MKARDLTAAVVVGLFLLVSAVGVYAEEKIVLKASDGIKEVLTAHIGKRVAVKTDSGESLEGSVSTVGDQLVRLERLTGKDFFDAVVRIDKISSVTIRVKGN
jgi:hypothetical protein